MCHENICHDNEEVYSEITATFIELSTRIGFKAIYKHVKFLNFLKSPTCHYGRFSLIAAHYYVFGG